MKRQFLFFGFSLISAMTMAQAEDPVIMKVNGKDIKKSEFEYIYKKNNNDEVIDKKTLIEYVELFKNFKLKVAEAQSQGLDTTQSFRKELNEYRAQLAKPYLSDMAIDEDLVRKEYERSKEYFEVSHIMLNVPKKSEENPEMGGRNFLPSDTLIGYKAADVIYKKLQKGQKFETLVAEYSEDEYSKKAPNPGFLGWATALQLPESLEDAVYATPAGKFSRPTLSSFGYHIFKVNAKKQDPGQIRAAHILLMCPADADTVTVSDAAQKIDSIYNVAVSGSNFAELAQQYSDDKGSGSQGGDLSWFGFGAMVPEFQDAAFALKEIGDISKPIRSQFGFHIIKLLDKKAPASYEEKRTEIISKLDRTDRSAKLHQPAFDKLKMNNGFVPNQKMYKELEEKAITLQPLDSAYLVIFENEQTTLFTAGTSNYSVADFIAYMKNNPHSHFRLSTLFVKDRLTTFENKSLLAEEDKNLEKKYPEFRNLMNEYRDGILLFEVSNNEVWEKASKDTLGLTAYFDRNKADYMWEKAHYKGYVVHCKDEKSLKKMKKQISKMQPESAADFLVKTYNSKDTTLVKIEKGLFVQGENKFVDELVFKGEKAEPVVDFPCTFVIGKVLNAPELYTDVRGLVITDYQNYLEKEWIKALNEKYPVIIYQDVVNTVK